MSRLRTWLSALPDVQYVPLFETHNGLDLCTRELGARKLLCRSSVMEQTLVDMVATELTRADWQGLLYVMAWGPRECLRPLYIGKAGRFGKTPGRLSANLARLADDKWKFARWGDGNAYHIGDLSQAVFGPSGPNMAKQISDGRKCCSLSEPRRNCASVPTCCSRHGDRDMWV